MRELDWPAVDAQRLARNHLSVPAPVCQLADVVRRACGIQAQVLSAAELALSARIPELDRAGFTSALWGDRSLVKTYGPRGTLHLLAADDVALHMAAMRAHPRWRDGAWLASRGIDPALAPPLLAAVADGLDGRTLGRDELATEVTARVGDWADELMRSMWGEVLAPAAFAGALCFAPSQGSRVRFARADQWVPGWAELGPEESLVEVVRRFFAAYGPAREADVASWLSMSPAAARPPLDALRPELEEVAVEGRRCWDLAARAGRARRVPPSVPSLKLLPQYDSYVLGHRQRDRLVPPAAKARIAADPKGRLEHVVGVPVMLVDGVVGGLWRRAVRGGRLEVRLEPTMALSDAHRSLVPGEVERLGAYLGTGAVLVDGGS